MGWWWSSGSSQPSNSTSESTPPSSRTSTPADRLLPDDLPTSHDALTLSSKLHVPPTSPEAETSTQRPDPTLYPTTMSCREAFDNAFYCQSLGGKFNDIYRFGEMKSCSDHWSSFWFCMRTKSKPEDTKARLIKEHYMQRAAKYKLGPSSEDVWEVRSEPLEGAFRGNPDEA